MSSSDFRALLAAHLPDIAAETLDRVVRYRNLVLEENERQNLTRILEPADFLYGHVLDAVELLKCGFLSYPAIDLGAGAGVPGLICAILDPKPWISVDSELMKAEFIRHAAEALDLSNVQVFAGRAEELLKKNKVGCVVARAVGPVERIYNWLRPCSTWNTLVLLKGPGWDEEWQRFQSTPKRKELKITGSHTYTAGPERKQRVIIRLERV